MTEPTPQHHDDLIDANGQPNVYRFCCPIFIGSFSFGAFLEPPTRVLPQEGEPLPTLRSGTLTLVRHDGEFYGLTCDHVVKALETAISKSKESNSNAAGADSPYPPEVQERFFFLKESRHVDINVAFERPPVDGMDLAYGWIPPEIFKEIGREAIDLDSVNELPQQWPDHAGALASGYPEANRRIYERRTPDDTLGVSNVTLHAGATKPVGTRLRIVAELEGKDVGNVDVLSGMSGGPIIVSCDDVWGLAAIISVGGDLQGKHQNPEDRLSPNPLINIVGEVLSIPELRGWLSAVKGKRTGRPTRHVDLNPITNRSGKKVYILT